MVIGHEMFLVEKSGTKLEVVQLQRVNFSIIIWSRELANFWLNTNKNQNIFFIVSLKLRHLKASRLEESTAMPQQLWGKC